MAVEGVELLGSGGGIVGGSVWEPQDGSQVDFMETRGVVDEVFYGGNRGGGKTDSLLMDYASGVVEWGSDWKGILFRRTYSQFRRIIERSLELYKDLWPEAQFRESDLLWRFPNGAWLQFFHMEKDRDAEKHLGLEYSWLGWDELPHWPTGGPYRRLKSTLRGTRRGVPRRIRATGNPGGVGLGWIKEYFRIPDGTVGDGPIVVSRDPETGTEVTRWFLRSTVRENKLMLDANPQYIQLIRDSCDGNEQLEKAWLDGDFNVFFGKFFVMFNPKVHCREFVELSGHETVPDDWKVYGSLDYGENDYTSFGLWCYGFSEVLNKNISVRVAEWYGRGLWASEYAGRIRDLVENCPITEGRFPEKVFADTGIWYTRADSQSNPMDRMVKDVFRRVGKLRLEKANKNRLNGWRWLKEKLSWDGTPDGEKIRKWPDLFYTPDCAIFEKQIENAMYDGDEDSPKEDINTRTEEHACDEARYYVMGALSGIPTEKVDRKPYQTWGEIKRGIGGKNRGRKVAYEVNAPKNIDVEMLVNAGMIEERQ
tara:strand:+ start:789 stop:2399 length:1611 start_codon:yes stop_codon:yes gene_type:complete